MREEERGFPLGAISAGVILIILAVAYLIYEPTINFSIIVDYFERMGNLKTFIKPPLFLFDPVVFFFNAVGAWSLILSGLRVVFQRSVRKAIRDITGAFFSFFIAFLLTNYAADIFGWQTTLAYFIIGIGVLVIVNGIIYFAFPERKVAKTK
ncbi:MAG: hypothetical protein OEZ25_03470 [Candidatus Bathyarchaeota archaeon]|nr:hypothetical protein [Candidatus Bathyarchaeota archaeon]